MPSVSWAGWLEKFASLSLKTRIGIVLGIVFGIPVVIGIVIGVSQFIWCKFFPISWWRRKLRSISEYREAIKELEKLNIPRLKERQMVKIIDILPTDIDSLRTLLIGENLIIKQEDLIKIVDVVKKYAK